LPPKLAQASGGTGRARFRAHGAEIESEPAEYDYREGYYAVFFDDPDGIKLELQHVPT
jgi:catechol 2,3-dioxygenase-like lactoylglutathione lyase family enzyme